MMKHLRLKSRQFACLESAFSAYLEALGYAGSTRRGLPLHVREFFHFLERRGRRGLQGVEVEAVLEYLDHLKRRQNQRLGGALSGSYRAKHVQALKLLRRYLLESGQAAFAWPEQVLVEATPAPITVLSRRQIAALYRACADDALGLRDRAMLSLYYGCGLRRSEAVALDTVDVLFARGLVYVRRAKGHRERYVPMAEGVVRDLQCYLEEARPRLAFAGQRALLVSQKGRRAQGQTLLLRLKRLCERVSSVDARQVGLHTLRHSIATHLLGAGLPLLQIAQFLGHESLESTQRYTHLLHAGKADDGNDAGDV